MYNRYIPKDDGSYHRRPVPESQQKQTTEKPEPVKKTEAPRAQKPVTHDTPRGFLKNMLPKNIDTGDLIVVMLLLLMAGDCEEEQNTALLTLALYFFM